MVHEYLREGLLVTLDIKIEERIINLSRKVTQRLFASISRSNSDKTGINE